MNPEIGFIGLGNMGWPMMTRLVAAEFRVVVFDVREDVVAKAIELGARPAASVHEVAERVETVLASLPTPQVSEAVVAELATGSKVRRFVDLSTVGFGRPAQSRSSGRTWCRRPGQPGQRRDERRHGRHPGGDGVRPAR